jgi:PiT family inorganic phosphate transporter
LTGAIAWNLIAGWLTVPTSSSHALIGGLIGAAVTHAGWSAIRWYELGPALVCILLVPPLAFVLGRGVMLAMSWSLGRWRPGAGDRLFRRGQLLSASLCSLGHGANDAQKSMGSIVALLIAAGIMDPEGQLSLRDSRTSWIILACQGAIAIGTVLGGWRMLRTSRARFAKLQPIDAFCADTGGAATLFLATYLGIPVSTTHAMAGSMVGVGSRTGVSPRRWGVTGPVVWAWVLTIPASALMASAGCELAMLVRSWH